jgi:hypothetical protein
MRKIPKKLFIALQPMKIAKLRKLFSILQATRLTTLAIRLDGLDDFSELENNNKYAQVCYLLLQLVWFQNNKVNQIGITDSTTRSDYLRRI